MSEVPAWMAPLYRDPNGNLRVVQHADTLTDLEAMAEAQGLSWDAVYHGADGSWYALQPLASEKDHFSA